jgi:hypothetical protein
LYRKFNLYLFAFFLFNISAFAKNYENKNYVCDYDSLPLTLAIIPINHEFFQICDTLSVILWSDTGYTQLISPGRVRKLLSKDTTLLDALIRISEYKYSKEERKKEPSINSILDSGDLAKLIDGLGSPRLLLFPLGIGTSSLGFATNGKINVRLYDLETGSLIYERDQQLLVEQGGEDGIKSLIIGLMGIAREHYNKYFFKKLKESQK